MWPFPQSKRGYIETSIKSTVRTIDLQDKSDSTSLFFGRVFAKKDDDLMVKADERKTFSLSSEARVSGDVNPCKHTARTETSVQCLRGSINSRSKHDHLKHLKKQSYSSNA